MWFNNFFKALTSTSSRRRPTSRPAARLYLEPLEDRRLLSFSPAVNYTVGDGPQAVVTADFNGDTRLDLAVTHYNTSDVSVLLGEAGGTFQSPLSSAGGSTSVAVGDFNADGRPDLAVGQVFSSYVGVLLGNGNGTFAASTPIDIGSYIGSRLSAVTVGDFNGDGKLDLGVTSHVEYPEDFQIERRANVLLGNGTGSFAAPIVTSLGDGSMGYSNDYIAAVAADFNGDGKCDLAAGDFGPTSVAVLLGTGSGALGAPAYFTGGAPIAAGDVSGDGKADLVTVSGDQLAVLLGTGMGTFGAPQYSSVGSRPGTAALADFNGDGKADLVATGVGVLLGNGGSGFKSTMGPATGAGLGTFAVGDFNSDSRPDVASVKFNSNNVAVFTNDGIWPALDAPSIAISDATVLEGNVGTAPATFTLTLSAASAQPVSVHYVTEDLGGTGAGYGYQAASGDVIFAAGVTTQTVTVLVNGNRFVSDSEAYFRVRLTNATNAFVADAIGLGTILDDEPRISVSTDYVRVTEGNTGTTDAVFTVSLSKAYDQEVAVDYDTSDSWAIAGDDYLQTSGALRFDAGQTSQTIRVPVIGDRVAEPEEDFCLDLHNPSSNAVITGGSTVGVILDDDTEIRIYDAGGQEGNIGTTSFTFYVGLSFASAQTISVNYTTADGSAVAGNDYSSTSGTLTFAPGQTLLAVTVDVTGDRLPEANETFFVNLSSPTNATIADGQGTGTILDDEPRISIGDVTKSEGGRNKKTQFTFTVTLSAAYDQAVTVSYRTADGTATTSDSDYVSKTGTITYLPGETTKTITIDVKADSKKEANETFYLDLFAGSSNSLFSKNRGVGTILNDD